MVQSNVGRYAQSPHYTSVIIDFCVGHMASESFPPEQVRAHLSALLPKLKYWKNRQ